MKQEINLLDEISLPRISMIHRKLFLQLIVLWVFILMAIYVVATNRLSKFKDQLRQVESVRNELLNQIAKANEKKKGHAYNGGIDSSGHKIGSPIGFYANLNDLAKINVKNVWLDKLYFSNSENLIYFQGHALFASAAVSLIQELAQAKSFQNKKFDIVDMKYNAEGSCVDFTIATDIIAVKGKDKQI